MQALDKKIRRYNVFWSRLFDNIMNNYLEYIAVTSRTRALMQSIEKSFGVGKSSWALWCSYILHYYTLYRSAPQNDPDNKGVWNLVLKHMTYDVAELPKWASSEERIPCLVWDDAQLTAPATASMDPFVRTIADYMTTSRTSIANLVMTMPSINDIAKPFRQDISYEIIIPKRGFYEIQFYKKQKNFYSPYEDKSRLIFFNVGRFEPPPEWVYSKYLEWREKERRRVLKRRLKRIREKQEARQKPAEPEEKAGIELTCPRCGYTWIYTGKRRRAICPSCGKSISLPVE